MEPLSLTCEYLPGVTLLSVDGELDLSTSDQLEKYCRGVCRPGDDVIFDLARLRFMDCSGLRALLHTHHHVRRDGGEVHLSRLQRIPALVIAIAHTDAVMRVHVGLDDAIRAVAKSNGGRRTSPKSPAIRNRYGRCPRWTIGIR
jgi:anti-anti-sigma factor